MIRAILLGFLGILSSGILISLIGGTLNPLKISNPYLHAILYRTIIGPIAEETIRSIIGRVVLIRRSMIAIVFGLSWGLSEHIFKLLTFTQFFKYDILQYYNISVLIALGSTLLLHVTCSLIAVTKQNTFLIAFILIVSLHGVHNLLNFIDGFTYLIRSFKITLYLIIIYVVLVKTNSNLESNTNL